MADSFPDIKTIVVRVNTDKPVRKTPYQVKGVFMRQFPDEAIVPMLNGSLRDQFLYPRVQVKILNEQIYIIGINEGVSPVLQLSEKFKAFDFGNITFEVESFDIEESKEQFIPSSKLLRYRFVTPWVALNHMTGGKYRFLTNQEKPSYLNKLIGQNIVFLANEVGIKLKDDIVTRVNVSSLFPKPVDDNKWGAFMGDFETNFVLPNYIGVGNGITRGFGTIFGVFNPDLLSFNKKELEEDTGSKEPLEIDKQENLEVISTLDVPKPKRKKRNNSRNKRKKQNKKIDSEKVQSEQSTSKKRINIKSQKKNQSSNKKYPRSGRVFSEEFDIEPDTVNIKPDVTSDDIDQKFNTEQHHKKQHKF
jgi:hypothetical protein